MGRRGSASIKWCILVGMAIAIVGIGRESLAAHYSFILTSDCYQCHNLNPDAVATDPATSYILNDSFVKRMKLVNGGTTPEVFGCTFCHQYTTNTVMRDAFFALKGGTSVHPVDFPYSVDAQRNVTIDFTSLNRDRAIYNSNWDNSFTDNSNTIACIDCHNVSMDSAAYPNHSPLWTDNTATAANSATARYYNPFMLRNVPSTPASGYSWSGGTVQGHAPNVFCLATCHDNSPGNQANNTTMGHYGFGAFAAGATLKEPSGTVIKTARCADCHETHTSRTKNNLFGELGNQASSQSYNLISESNCTGVCHTDAAFLASGHKTRPNSASFTCLSCHDSATSHRSASNPRRLSSAEDARKSTLTQDMRTNGLDDDYNGVIDDAGEQSFAYSLESSCRTCHQTYVAHNGTISGASPSSGTASCLNCHDPHGKGVFNGTDNNIRMVRARVMGENTAYTARPDMWRSDGRGMCDNPACHGGKPMGDNNLAAGTIMGDVSDHRAAGVTYSTDCTGCHLHTTESGSFQPACNGCHDYAGQRHLSNAHPLSAVHRIHAYSTNQTLPTTETGYGFTCGTCHNSFNHNQMGIANGSQWDNTNNAVVQVVFDPAINPGATYTLGATPYTGTCSNLTCHGATLPVPARGTQVTPRWNVAADGDCGTCHRATGAAPPGTAAHLKHASSDYNSGYNYGCQTCHSSTTPDGTTIPVSGRATHVNRLANVSFNPGNPYVSGGTYTGTTTVGDNSVATCGNIYCHSPGYAKTAPFDNGALGAPNWNAGAALACNACHGAAGQTGIVVGAPAYANGVPKVNTHGKHVADGFGCQVCHYTTTQNGTSVIGSSRIYHVNGIDNVVSEGNLALNPTATPRQLSHNFTFNGALNTCNTAACHGWGAAAPVWGQTAGIPIACAECHRNSAGAAATADVDDFGWDNGVMSKIRDSEWTTTGHGRSIGNYSSGRAAANFTSCTARCHSTGVSHNAANNPFRLIDYAANTDFNDTTDPRSLKDNRVCLDCHSTGGATPSGSTLHVQENHFGTKHSGQNRGGSFCWDCHDPHGDASDSMIHDNVTRVSDGQYGVPVTRVATSFSRTNLNGESYNTVYDWGDYVKNTAPYSGICQVCHSATGGAAFFNDGTYTADHNKDVGQGQRCTACHLHTADFAPNCNGCHSYPGITGGTWTQAMSPVHAKHVGTPTDWTNTRRYACSACHFRNVHNDNNIAAGAAWPSNYYTLVDVRFDPALNPVNANPQRYAGVPADGGQTTPARGVGPSGANPTCEGLHCHGNSSTQATWGGNTVTAPPQWDNTPTASCGTCHVADATMPQGNHPAHLSAAYGPGAAAFTADGRCSEGAGCHTRYLLRATSSHVDGLVSFRTSPADNTAVALGTTQICRNCHTTYTSARIPISGDNLVRTQANWDNPAYFVDCLTCHNGQAAGTQARANLDGSGGVAHAIEGTLFTMQHGIQGIGCGWCHTDMGHIGANRPVSTNPYRLGSYYDEYATLGQVDYRCEWCHNMFTTEHCWRVEGQGAYGPTAKGSNDTHPTTVPAVGTGKDRWYQIPSATYMPLFGDIMDNNYNRSSGSNNYVLCITCHDPHGVGTSPVPSAVRRFSGQNTDAMGNKALRFNYSSGTPTTLCSQCHM